MTLYNEEPEKKRFLKKARKLVLSAGLLSILAMCKMTAGAPQSKIKKINKHDAMIKFGGPDWNDDGLPDFAVRHKLNSTAIINNGIITDLIVDWSSEIGETIEVQLTEDIWVPKNSYGLHFSSTNLTISYAVLNVFGNVINTDLVFYNGSPYFIHHPINITEQTFKTGTEIFHPNFPLNQTGLLITLLETYIIIDNDTAPPVKGGPFYDTLLSVIIDNISKPETSFQPPKTPSENGYYIPGLGLIGLVGAGFGFGLLYKKRRRLL